MNHLRADKLGPGALDFPAPPPPARVAGFRTKVLVWMMLVVTGVTALTLYFAQRSVVANFERDLERDFQVELATLQNAQEIRMAALVERCRALVRKPRIVGALEEAPDILYDNAADELRDVTAPRPTDASSQTLRANFYRFLDRHGKVILPGARRDVGALERDEEMRLALPGAPERQQLGYLARTSPTATDSLAELIAMPILSTDTGEPIGALVLGFKPLDFESRRAGGMKSGIWFDGRLHSSTLDQRAREAIAATVREIVSAPPSERPTRVEMAGTRALVLAQRLNPGSAFPPAHEVCVVPLTNLLEQQRRLSWQVVGAGTLLLLIGLGASHFASVRLSAPVEKLVVDSERSARFSADASHQLKTPVTVLRAGLEELLTRDNLTPEECDQLSALIHQTYRLSTLIEDLLLLSRMDAGRLKLELSPVNLSHLIEASLDDLSALPDELGVEVETAFPAGLHILGEKRYTAIILQNLLENARKYNRRGGTIRITARVDADVVLLTVGNTGHPITPPAQAHIFERFHRGAIGENVPGYGLGLNLARELARLHQGDLRLSRSDAEWTEFEARFRVAAGGEGKAVV